MMATLGADSEDCAAGVVGQMPDAVARVVEDAVEVDRD